MLSEELGKQQMLSNLKSSLRLHCGAKATCLMNLRKPGEAGTHLISQRLLLEQMGRRKFARNFGKFIVISITLQLKIKKW